MLISEESIIIPSEGREYSPVSLTVNGEVRTIDLTEGQHTIGCGDVEIRVGLNDKYVSDHQSTLTVKKDLLGQWGLYIQDMPDTVNLTRVNGWPCTENFNYRLSDGDKLRMGMTYLTVHYNGQ